MSHCIDFECFVQWQMRGNTASGDLSATSFLTYENLSVVISPGLVQWFRDTGQDPGSSFFFAIIQCWLFVLMPDVPWLQSGHYNAAVYLTSESSYLKAL